MNSSDERRPDAGGAPRLPSRCRALVRRHYFVDREPAALLMWLPAVIGACTDASTAVNRTWHPGGMSSQDEPEPVDIPTVLFLCVHNAGRSQMALGFFRHYAGDRAVAWSGGSEPGHQINPIAIEAMRERDIDISQEHPKRWTNDIVSAADVVITMGCGDSCPVFPGKRYEDWQLADPAGQDLESVRTIRDEIEHRVRQLLRDLRVEAPAQAAQMAPERPVHRR